MYLMYNISKGKAVYTIYRHNYAGSKQTTTERGIGLQVDSFRKLLQILEEQSNRTIQSLGSETSAT